MRNCYSQQYHTSRRNRFMSSIVISNDTLIFHINIIPFEIWHRQKHSMMDNFIANFRFGRRLGFVRVFDDRIWVSVSLSSPMNITLSSIRLTTALSNCTYNSYSGIQYHIFRDFAHCCQLTSTSRDLMNTPLAFEAVRCCVRRTIRRTVRRTVRLTVRPCKHQKT
jgi:hypothetical protein